MNHKGLEKIRRARGECPLLGFYSRCVGYGEGQGQQGRRPQSPDPATVSGSHAVTLG